MALALALSINSKSFHFKSTSLFDYFTFKIMKYYFNF